MPPPSPQPLHVDCLCYFPPCDLSSENTCRSFLLPTLGFQKTCRTRGGHSERNESSAMIPANLCLRLDVRRGGILRVKCRRNQQVPCDELRRETNYFPHSSFCGQALTSLAIASFPSFVLFMSRSPLSSSHHACFLALSSSRSVLHQLQKDEAVRGTIKHLWKSRQNSLPFTLVSSSVSVTASCAGDTL